MIGCEVALCSCFCNTGTIANGRIHDNIGAATPAGTSAADAFGKQARVWIGGSWSDLSATSDSGRVHDCGRSNPWVASQCKQAEGSWGCCVLDCLASWGSGDHRCIVALLFVRAWPDRFEQAHLYKACVSFPHVCFELGQYVLGRCDARRGCSWYLDAQEPPLALAIFSVERRSLECMHKLEHRDRECRLFVHIAAFDPDSEVGDASLGHAPWLRFRS